MWTIIDSSHAKTEETSKRASVTRLKCANGCLMATYRSPLIKAMWIKEVETLTTDIAFVRACNAHVALEMSSSKTVIINAMKEGCTRTATTKSVEASKASPIFDLWLLSCDFILTAIITSAFKAAVTGNVRMWTTVIIIRKVWVSVEGWCSLPPIST